MCLNPFAAWDDRYKTILGGALTHLGTVRIVLAFSVHRLINGNIPFSEVAGAWYRTNAYKWDRLLVDSGRLQLVRSIKDPNEIATTATVKRVALNEINPEDNIPYYDEFVRDVGELESMGGALEYQSGLRNRLVTFIAENCVPRETGRIVCPACLTETANNLSICIRCSGSLISWGERTAGQNEGAPPGMPEREKSQSGDETGDAEGDMDKDEIDRLVKETKAKTEARTDDDVDMTAPQSSQAASSGNGRSTRSTPQPKTTVDGETKEQQEAEDERQAEEEEQAERQRERLAKFQFGQQGLSQDVLSIALTSLRMKMPLILRRESSIS